MSTTYKGSLTQCCVKGESKITKVDAENPAFVSSQAEPYINDYITRWREAIKDARCLKVLHALYATNAFSPRFTLSARSIGRLAGLHHQVVKRLIRGDKRCKAKLTGLVAWQTGRKGQKTRYWLTPEGRKVAELIAKGFQVGKATLTALATDRQRRKVAHLPKVAHQSGTPSENNMQSYDCFNVCSLTAVSALKPVSQKPANGLAARLWQDYGVALKVANDLVARYSPAEIEAAIALREKRNGVIYNEAGFIVYLLGNGFARNYVRARLQARQRAQPPPNEPDFDKAVQALRDALSPYGIRVDDDCCAEFANGRVPLPPDPDKAIAFLRRHGLLRETKADQPTTDEGFRAADDLHDDLHDALADAIADRDPTDWASDQLTDLTEADQSTDPTDDDLPTDDDDEGEPLPPPACEVCGRSEGEPHPALQSWQRNDFLCLSELSDAFKQRFGLPECGLLCRGCYVTLCARLANPADLNGNGQSADQDAPANEPTEPDPTDDFWAADSDIAAEATLKATEPTEAPADQDTQDTIDDNPLADNAADDDLADATNEAADQDPPDWAADEAIDDSDGQNDPSGDKENCPSPLLPLPDSAAEGLKPIVRDLLISHQSDGATEIVRDGITYRLKDFHCLDYCKAFALIEADPITMSPPLKALIDELCRLYKRDGTVAIERDGFRVEIAEVIPITQGKTLYRFSVTKLGRGRKG